MSQQINWAYSKDSFNQVDGDPNLLSVKFRGKATFLIGIGGSAIAPADDLTTHFRVDEGGDLVEILAWVKTAIAEDLTFRVNKSSDNGATWTSLTSVPFTIPSGSTAVLSVAPFIPSLATGDLLSIDCTAGHPQDVTVMPLWRA